MQFKRKVVFFTLFIALVLLCSSIEKVYSSAYKNWSGAWLTNQGELNLKQDGKKISGTYSVNKEIRGQVEGKILGELGFVVRGKYYQGMDSGMFKLRLVDGDESFQGWLKSSDNTWNGRRLSVSESNLRQQEMTILNNSPYHITALFVCPANSEKWQEVLGGAQLRHGRQRNIVFNLNNNVSTWDIKVVDSSGNFTVFQNLKIDPEFTSIDYYYKNRSGRIQFAVG